MTGVEEPGASLIKKSRRLFRMIRARDSLATQAQLVAIERAGQLPHALRTWLLVTSELGSARLPGGDLVDGGGDLVLGILGPPDELWQALVSTTVRAALSRDGAGVFASLDKHEHVAGRLSYLAAIATTAQVCVEQVSIRDDILNATHLLGMAAGSPLHYSVAGVGVRLVSATLSVMDAGQTMAETIIGPEIDTLGKLDHRQRTALVGVMGTAYGMVMGPGSGFVAHPASGAKGQSDVHQVRAAELAIVVGQAYRSGDIRQIMRLAETLRSDEIALAVFGLGNLLATRSRDLWGR